MFKFFAVQPVKAALVSGAFLVLGFSVSPLANESSRFGVLSTEISRKIVEGIEEARQERIATWQARISGSHDAFPEDDKEVRENADLEPENSYQIADNKRIERPDFLKENKDEGWIAGLFKFRNDTRVKQQTALLSPKSVTYGARFASFDREEPENVTFRNKTSERRKQLREARQKRLAKWRERMAQRREAFRKRIEERREQRLNRVSALRAARDLRDDKRPARRGFVGRGEGEGGWNWSVFRPRLNDPNKVKVKPSKPSAAPKGKYGALIAKYAKQHGVPYALARAVVQVESSFRPNVTGAAGEIGLMQIKLATARGMGYKGSRKQLYNPATNLYWGMKYLGKAYQLAGGNTCGTILRYNAGHYAKRMNKISARYCGRVKRILA